MFREALRFLLRHWPHALLVIPGVLGVTILHEGAHALAAMAQGGIVTEFVWLPSPGRWGYTAYHFPPGVAYSSFAISIAPYVMWTGMAAVATLLALLPVRWPFWI